MKKILIEKETNLIIDQCDDFILLENHVIAIENSSLKYIYACLSKQTSFVVESIEEELDIFNEKYFYINGEILLNPDYKDE